MPKVAAGAGRRGHRRSATSGLRCDPGRIARETPVGPAGINPRNNKSLWGARDCARADDHRRSPALRSLLQGLLSMAGSARRPPRERDSGAERPAGRDRGQAVATIPQTGRAVGPGGALLRCVRPRSGARGSASPTTYSWSSARHPRRAPALDLIEAMSLLSDDPKIHALISGSGAGGSIRPTRTGWPSRSPRANWAPPVTLPRRSLSDAELKDTYVAADVFAILSKHSWGLAPLEAIASGTRVILARALASTTFSPIATACRPFPAQDPSATAQAIRRWRSGRGTQGTAVDAHGSARSTRCRCLRGADASGCLEVVGVEGRERRPALTRLPRAARSSAASVRSAKRTQENSRATLKREV